MKNGEGSFQARALKSTIADGVESKVWRLYSLAEREKFSRSGKSVQRKKRALVVKYSVAEIGM